MLFFFISNFIIKVSHSAYMLVAYRYKYEEELRKYAKDNRKINIKI